MKKILVIDQTEKSKRMSRLMFMDSRSMVSLIIKDKSKYSRKQKHKDLD